MAILTRNGKPLPYGIYFIKSDIFTIVRLRHFMDCMVFHYGVVVVDDSMSSDGFFGLVFVVDGGTSLRSG